MSETAEGFEIENPPLMPPPAKTPATHPVASPTADWTDVKRKSRTVHTVDKSNRLTQSGKNEKKALRPLREQTKATQVNVLKNLDSHAKLMAVKPEEWTQLRLTVDSSAGETVFPPSEAVNAKTDDGEKKGCRYELAIGAIIRNQGVKKIMVVMKGGGHTRP